MGGKAISLAQEARKLDAIEKINETHKRNQKKETQRETKIATHTSTLSSALVKLKEDETSGKSLERQIAKVNHQSAENVRKHSCLTTLSLSI